MKKSFEGYGLEDPQNRPAQVHAEGGRGDRLLVLLAVLARVRGAEFDGRFGAFLVLVLLRLLLFSVAAHLTLRHGDLQTFDG